MIALASDFDVFAAGIPTNFSAIFLPIRNFAPAWNMCAFLSFFSFHDVISSLVQLTSLK